MDELLLLGLLWLLSGRGGGGRGDLPTGPSVEPPRPGGGGGGGGGGDPGASGGRVWGSGDTPAGWNPASNLLYISPDCELVLEGAGFEPRSRGSFEIKAIEESTLTDTLAISGNSVFGYIDWLLANTALSTPEQIALQVASEANALCADLPPSQRPAALAQWLASFTERIRLWVEESTGVAFEG